MKKILVMGLPGSGKTTFAEELKNQLSIQNKKCVWINADDVRKRFDDWDFSHEGRIRQATRMKNLSTHFIDEDYVICDFVAPLKEMRDIFAADFTVWLNTEQKSQYSDTDKIFEKPDLYHYNYVILQKDFIKTAASSIAKII